jgi:hypothetical protein
MHPMGSDDDDEDAVRHGKRVDFRVSTVQETVNEKSVKDSINR